MIPLAELLGGRGPSAEQAETRDLIHEICLDWHDRGLPLAEVRQRTSGAERFLAFRLTDPKGPMWGPMARMFDHLVRTDATSQYGYHYATRQGVFSKAELSAAEARHVKLPDGRLQFLFPIRHPWRRRPTEKGEPGERGQPVYAATFDERWDVGNSAHKPVPSNRSYFDVEGHTL